MERQNYYEQNEENKPSAPKRIGDFLPKFAPPTAKKTNGGVNSPFNDAISRVVEFMDEKGKFGYWCGRCRKIAPFEIDAMLSISRRDGKKPRAYFVFLLKKYREREKEAKKLSTTKKTTATVQSKNAPSPQILRELPQEKLGESAGNKESL